MRDIHPFLVLSPTQFNAQTSLVLGLPMTTANYNATNPFAVVAGTTPDAKTSYILCHQVKSFDWRQRNATQAPTRPARCRCRPTRKPAPSSTKSSNSAPTRPDARSPRVPTGSTCGLRRPSTSPDTVDPGSALRSGRDDN
nr:type II toxin-antitoxin system PemK/MazF family toxin [Thioalkalivibrio sp. ALMg3]